jgi:hypothetical protein
LAPGSYAARVTCWLRWRPARTLRDERRRHAPWPRLRYTPPTDRYFFLHQHGRRLVDFGRSHPHYDLRWLPQPPFVFPLLLPGKGFRSARLLRAVFSRPFPSASLRLHPRCRLLAPGATRAWCPFCLAKGLPTFPPVIAEALTLIAKSYFACYANTEAGRAFSRRHTRSGESLRLSEPGFTVAGYGLACVFETLPPWC